MSTDEVLRAVVRLYSVDHDSPHTGRLNDLEELCATLAVVPMTVDQRERVDSGLRKLGEATKRADNYERHAEQAIESITNETGIDDYHVAAKAVLATWHAIEKLHGIFHTTTAERLIAVAEGTHKASTEGAWLLGIKREWGAWATSSPKAKAQRRVINILQALRESMDAPLEDAIDETIHVLEHILDEIPF